MTLPGLAKRLYIALSDQEAQVTSSRLATRWHWVMSTRRSLTTQGYQCQMTPPEGALMTTVLLAPPDDELGELATDHWTSRQHHRHKHNPSHKMLRCLLTTIFRRLHQTRASPHDRVPSHFQLVYHKTRQENTIRREAIPQTGRSKS